MKRSIITSGVILAASFTLTNCALELVNSDENFNEGIPFEICAGSVDTKTTLDGLVTKWASGDAINLFHAAKGSADYVSDGSFTTADAGQKSGLFTGNLASALDVDASYDWYALYPYSEHISTPANTGTKGYVTVGGKIQTQDGLNSMAHLCDEACPLYGIAKNVSADETPSIEMNHLTSIIEIKVTNNSGKPLTVSNVSFTAPEDIVGTYYINFVSDPVVYTGSGASYVSSTASLVVNNSEPIADSGYATFYIAIKPFTAKTGDKLSLKVNEQVKEITLESNVVFAAGKIKPLTVTYEKGEPIIYKTDFSYPYDNAGYQLSTEILGTDPENETSWGIVYGNWNSSQTAQMRVYTAGNFGSVYMKFDVTNAIKVSYDAMVSSSDLKLNTYYSTDSGETWTTVDSAKELTTTSRTYSFIISETGEYEKCRIKFEATGTPPSTSNYQLTIDNVVIYGNGTIITRPRLAKPSGLSASLDIDTPNTINVKWNSVENAGHYEITATPSTGTVISKTTEGTSYTLTGLLYETVYSISVIAIPSDNESYRNSEAALSGNVTTGAKPADAPEWIQTAITSIQPSDVVVIVGGGYGITNDTGTSSAPNAIPVTIEDGKIVSNVPDNIKWNITGNSTDGYVFYPNGDSAKWLYCNTTAGSSSNNNIRVGTGNRKQWVPDNNGYYCNTTGGTETYVIRVLSLYNSTPDWRGYANTTNNPQALEFYVLSE